MKTSDLQHPTVRAALDALRDGETERWQALFSPDAQLFDDGKPRDLARFTADALGTEWFTDIETESEDGLRVDGPFHTEQWGDFHVYFQFQLNDAGLITRLDIGQTSKLSG